MLAYNYDALGNMLSVVHTLSTNPSNGWTRTYSYNTNFPNNYLQSAYTGSPGSTQFTYDVHGNMLTMPHLSAMTWDFADQLKSTTKGDDTTYYVYSGGERVRKVLHGSNGKRQYERIYLGGYELYRTYDTAGTTVQLERKTYHIMDDKRKIALLEVKTKDSATNVTNPVTITRYQYTNHLDSASLELDENALIISYEEFHPFGSTAYQLHTNNSQVSLKRYRYVHKERDEETGLYYYGARYHAGWLCRFVSVDPLKDKYPFYSTYQYAGNQPITFVDLDGLEPGNPPLAQDNTAVASTPHPSAGFEQTKPSFGDEFGQVGTAISNTLGGTNKTFEVANVQKYTGSDGSVTTAGYSIVSRETSLAYTITYSFAFYGSSSSSSGGNMPAISPGNPEFQGDAGSSLPINGESGSPTGGFRFIQFTTVIAKDPAAPEMSTLDMVQLGLDVIGLVPVAGEFADGINAVIHLARGEYLYAGMSAAAIVPGLGWGATGSKWAVKAAKYGDEVVEAGSEVSGLYRKTENTGEFAGLEVAMQHRNVTRAAESGGVGLEGVRVRINRDPELIGKNIFGYAHPNGKLIDLYPDAFTNTETLIRTLGHERTHLFQFGLYGAPTSSAAGRLLEDAAWEIEDSFIKYWRQNGGR